MFFSEKRTFIIFQALARKSNPTLQTHDCVGGDGSFLTKTMQTVAPALLRTPTFCRTLAVFFQRLMEVMCHAEGVSLAAVSDLVKLTSGYIQEEDLKRFGAQTKLLDSIVIVTI